jgi:hypothetical protein
MSIGRLSTDIMLGGAGCCMAVASLGFGLYMNAYGPAPGFGTSHDFTVFAQLAPSARRGATAHPATAASVTDADALDMTATASIPKNGASTFDDGAGPSRIGDGASIITSVTLRAATEDTATIEIDGRTSTVRVGDTIPGAGEVIEILPGRRPLVRASRGLILSSR